MSKRPGLLRDARAFAEAMFASEEGPPPESRLDWAMRELDDFLDHGGPRVELIFRGGLALGTWAAPPLLAKAPPLARLDVRERQIALDKLEHTPAGLPMLAVKAMLCIIWYEHPETLREIGVTTGDEAAPSCMTPQPVRLEVVR
jgi:hypothetical protein